jgi:hypothetical protein
MVPFPNPFVLGRVSDTPYAGVSPPFVLLSLNLSFLNGVLDPLGGVGSAAWAARRRRPGAGTDA